MKAITTQDYTTTLLVSQTPEHVFDAINNVAAWWSASFEGRTEKLNDIFTVRFGEVYITSEITELVPAKKIVWHVTDCNKPWLKNTKEWNGTDMIWEISKKGEQTQLRFRHLGLVPELECYDVCSNAWSEYLQQSLLPLITKGKGKPTTTKKG